MSRTRVGSYAQGQGHNYVRGQNVLKHNKKVCHAQDIGSYAQGHGYNQVRGQNRVSAITKKLLEQI